MSFDDQERRDTPLAAKLKDQMRAAGGPIDLKEFVGACLWDEEHGYYATKRVIGAAGDFVTAPEISQVFGEIIGLWSAVVWQSMGAPAKFNLIELGPGRGTLMADALRAAVRVPGFKEAVEVVMVEASPVLETAQRETLTGVPVPVRWGQLGDNLAAPSIVLANEFIDVFGPDQSIKTAEGWRWRAVALDEQDRFQFTASHGTRLRPELDAQWPDAPEGAIYSHLDTRDLADVLKPMADGYPFAALFIDYGHTDPALGDTLQAVRSHAHEHPLASPGEADLTLQVDFADVIGEMQRAGFIADGPTTQAEFLGRLGVIERASRLMAANPAKADAIQAGVMRLMAPNGMGTRFKVIGVRTPDVPQLPGFA